MIITIDGEAASGKTTLAKELSKTLDIPYYETGAFYRCITLYCIEHNIPHTDEGLVEESIKNCHIRVEDEGIKKIYFVNDLNVTKKLRSDKVTDLVSQYAALKSIRHEVFLILRNCVGDTGVVEGRDMGTTVFPQADLKLFLKASLNTRAKRRIKDLNSQFPDSSQEVDLIEKSLKERDYSDSNREHSPLRYDESSMVSIDTSDKSIEKTVEIILELLVKMNLLESKE